MQNFEVLDNFATADAGITGQMRAEPCDYELLERAGLRSEKKGEVMICGYTNGIPQMVANSSNPLDWKQNPNQFTRDVRSAVEHLLPRSAGRYVLGDWRLGAWDFNAKRLKKDKPALTVEEVQMLAGKYGLIEVHAGGLYNHEGVMKFKDEVGEYLEDTRISLRDGMTLDLDVPAEHAIYNLLLGCLGEGIVDKKEQADFTTNRFYFEYIQDHRNRLREENNRAMKAFDLVKSKTTEEKCEVIEWLSYKVPESVQITPNFIVDDFVDSFNALARMKPALILDACKHLNRRDEIYLYRAISDGLVSAKSPEGPFFLLNDQSVEIAEIGATVKDAAHKFKTQMPFRAAFNKVSLRRYGLDQVKEESAQEILQREAAKQSDEMKEELAVVSGVALISANKSSIDSANKAELLHFLSHYDPDHLYNEEYSKKELQQACMMLLEKIKRA